MKHRLCVRIPSELFGWIETEINRRQCDITSVVMDALRLSATAGNVLSQSINPSEMLEMMNMLSVRLDGIERRVVQVGCYAGAVAEDHGVKDRAQEAFKEWVAKNQGGKQ